VQKLNVVKTELAGQFGKKLQNIKEDIFDAFPG
jgi:hypothetical protein